MKENKLRTEKNIRAQRWNSKTSLCSTFLQTVTQNILWPKWCFFCFHFFHYVCTNFVIPPKQRNLAEEEEESNRIQQIYDW